MIHAEAFDADRQMKKERAERCADYTFPSFL